ncbi:MAG: hypothetical protein ACK54P_11255, partial [Bacteroidota bacterium]
MRTRTTLILLLFLMAVPSVKSQLLTPAQLDTARIYRSVEAALQSALPVYRLDLSRQKLEAFPAEILRLTQLQELRLSRNT